MIYYLKAEHARFKGKIYLGDDLLFECCIKFIYIYKAEHARFKGKIYLGDDLLFECCIKYIYDIYLYNRAC
jgi:3-hydroxymyristoyl/3-hydroxydecanoyl-(acyl carrier protein) dehydratase